MTILTSMIDKYRPLMAPPDEGGGGASAAPASSSSSPAAGSESGSTAAPDNSGGGTTGSSPGGSAGSPPSTPPTPSTPSTPSSDSMDFASIFEPELRAPEPAPPSVAAPAAPKPAPAPAQPTPQAAPSPPAQEPPAQVQPQTQQPPQPGAPESGQQPPASQSEAQLDPYDPGQLVQRLAQNEAAAIEHLATTMFAMTPQEIEALETDVVGTVPKLLAKALVKSQQATLSQMARMMPVMIQRQTVALRENAKHEDAFYSRWPDIKKDQHGALVQRYAAVFRQMHPNATPAEMIEQLGPMVMMSAKIAPTLQPAGVAPGAAPVNPMARPVAPGAPNGRPPPPSAFVPAGAGPVSEGSQPELAPWEAMFQQQE